MCTTLEVSCHDQFFAGERKEGWAKPTPFYRQALTNVSKFQSTLARSQMIAKFVVGKFIN